MGEWLLAPIDSGRAHEVGFAISWHARSMVLAWGILAPLAVFAARFLKIAPGQNWPQELDSKLWWRTHWMGQAAVAVLSVGGLILVLPSDFATMSMHGWLGYGVFVGLVVQLLLGIFRGSKGGPTAPAPDGSFRGHHYDMTPWRRAFELLHKSTGYGVLLLAVATIVFGLWHANAPRWMWLTLGLWWPALTGLFITLQKRGFAVDTYQAIWGDDPIHPGNRLPPPRWGVRRLGATPRDSGENNVRFDRGDGVRSH